MPPGLWALNGTASFAGAPSEHSGLRNGGMHRGGLALSPPSRAGADCFGHGRTPKWLSLDKPAHYDLAGASGSCGWRADPGS